MATVPNSIQWLKNLTTLQSEFLVNLPKAKIQKVIVKITSYLTERKCISNTKANRLMLFTKQIVVYSENKMKHKYPSR